MRTAKRVYTALNALSGVAQKVLEGVAAFLIFTCALDLFFQVLYRFVIIKFVSFSFPFTEEYARYALIWSTYLCAGICLKNGSMASVNLLYDRLKTVPKLVLYYATRVVFVVFLAVGLIYGWKAIQNNQIYLSPVMRIPGVFLYSAPFVGCVLMAYETITEFLGVLTGELKPFVGRPDAVEEIPDVCDEKIEIGG